MSDSSKSIYPEDVVQAVYSTSCSSTIIPIENFLNTLNSIVKDVENLKKVQSTIALKDGTVTIDELVDLIVERLQKKANLW